jgi:hypothetical protein
VLRRTICGEESRRAIPRLKLLRDKWWIQMIQKTVNKHDLREVSTAREDLAYWLSKAPEERIAAVDTLRRQYDGSSARLQRVARVIQRPQR